MEEHITPERIANAIMQTSSFKGHYLIVEGPKDSRLYGKFINDEVVIIKEAFGNEKVQSVMNILSERGFDRKIGIIDRDFRTILKEYVDIDGLFITDDHDIEVMIIKTKALENILRHFCSKNKINEFEKRVGKTIRDQLFSLGTEVGYLKLANKIYDLGLVFKPKKPEGNQLKYKDFIQGKNWSYLGDEQLINTVFNYSVNKSSELKEKSEIEKRLSEIKNNTYDTDQLVNGHDLTHALYILLKKTLASTSKLLNDVNSIETCLSLTYEYEDFKKTTLFKKMQKWENQNQIKLFA